MKPKEFDLRVIAVINAFRTLANEKQANIASLLDITQPEYCRIEKGERALTIGHLDIICRHLKISLVQVIIFAEASFIIDMKLTPLSVIFTKFVRLVEEKDATLVFSRAEFEFIFNKIRERTPSAYI